MIDKSIDVPAIMLNLADGSRLLAMRSKGGPILQGSTPQWPNLGYSSKLAKGLLQGKMCWSLVHEGPCGCETVGLCVRTQGKLGSSLYVSLLVDPSDRRQLWVALNLLAARSATTDLTVERFCRSFQDDTLPPLEREVQRYSNVKLYVWMLASDDWDKGISPNHRRNIARARKAGVQIASLPRSEALKAHLGLIDSSLKRRAERGEPTSLASNAREVEEILATGQAQIFQAAVDGVVVSSKIAFVVDNFGYYDSGGTSEHGMKLGASHYLMHSIASSLRQRGVVSLNLDVASAAAGGLARYKADFGADEWFVSRVMCKHDGVARVLTNAWRGLTALLR